MFPCFIYSDAACLCATLCHALKIKKRQKHKPANQTISVVNETTSAKPENFTLIKQPCAYPIFNGINGCQEVKSISQGGYGKVYLVKMIDLEQNQQAALKDFHYNEFECEKEKGILQIIATGEKIKGKTLQIAHVREDIEGVECPNLMLEYIPGFDLDHRLLHQYEFPILLNFVKHLMNQIGYGVLQELHSMNIYHNDLKPNNIMFDPSRQKFYLVDFGLAVPLSLLNQWKFHRANFFTTINFMSPWHLRILNESSYDPEIKSNHNVLNNKETRSYAQKADYYSLGLTIIRILGRFCRGTEPLCAMTKWIYSIQQTHFETIEDRAFGRMDVAALARLYSPYWQRINEILTLYLKDYVDECADADFYFISNLFKWLDG